MVSIVRRFVEETFEKLVGDPDAIFRISMAAHELLENAAKYSVGRRAVLRVVLEEQSEGGAGAYISLSNETTLDHVDRLKARVDEINAAPEPFILYQEMMRRNLGSRDESGLGLVRIRAEGEMSLGCDVSGSTVTIIASARVLGRNQ